MTAFTANVTQHGSTSSGLLMRIKVLTGIAATQNGATASQSGTAAHQASITTTAAGSVVYGAMLDVGSVAFTANANSTVMDSTHLTDGITHGSCKASAATVTPGAITIGASAPAHAGLLALAEILASGTIAEDSSSPAPVSGTVQTLTTAAFNPPLGSLILAMISSNGGAGSVTVTMSDTSGLGLTWAPLEIVNPAGGGGAFLYAAAMPAPPPAATPAADLPVLMRAMAGR